MADWTETSLLIAPRPLSAVCRGIISRGCPKKECDFYYLCGLIPSMMSRSPNTSMASLISEEMQSLRSGSWLSKWPSPAQRQVVFPVRVKLAKEQGLTTISSSSPTQATPRESVCSQVFAEDSCRKGTRIKATKIITLGRLASGVCKSCSELEPKIRSRQYQCPPTPHIAHRLVVRASPPPPPTIMLESKKYILLFRAH